MKKNHFHLLVLSAIISIVLSCHTPYQSQSLQYRTYRVTDTVQKDAGLLDLLKPYSENVNKTMNDIVGIADISLEKNHPNVHWVIFWQMLFLRWRLKNMIKATQ